MKLIQYVFKKYLVSILSIGFLIVFAATMRVFANGWPYAPGATLNPGCGPTDEDCIVEIPSNYWSKAGDTGTYVIPTAFGAAGTVLTDVAGNGILSWEAGGGGTPGGLNTQVQFNDSEAFGGDASFTWDKANSILKVPTIQGVTGTEQIIFNEYSINDIGISADGNVYAKGWIWVDNTTAQMGFGSGPQLYLDSTTASLAYGDLFYGIGIDEASFTSGKSYINIRDGLHIRIEHPTKVIINTPVIDIEKGGETRFYDTDNSNYVGLKSPALTSDSIYTLPIALPASNKVLQSDNAGILSWVGGIDGCFDNGTNYIVFTGGIITDTGALPCP